MKRLAIICVILATATMAVSSALAAPPIVKVSPTHVNFGTEPVGTTSSADITVTNTSSMSLHILIDGGNQPDDFNFGNIADSTCIAIEGQILAPGESCVAVIAFEPSDLFARQHQMGTLLVTVSDPSSGAILDTVTIVVRGRGK